MAIIAASTGTAARKLRSSPGKMSTRPKAASHPAESTTAVTTDAARRCVTSKLETPAERSGSARHRYHGERQTNASATQTGTMIATVSSAGADTAAEIKRPRIAPTGTHAARY